MSEQEPDADPIEVEYTAVLRYEPWEVEEYDITEQAAIENLLNGVKREPENYGWIEVNE